MRNMTALDLVTAYGAIPGREDVALFLEEAMKGEGWEGSTLSVKRRHREAQAKQSERRRSELHAIDRILELQDQERWWSGIDLFERGDSRSMDEGFEKELDSLYVSDFMRYLYCSVDFLMTDPSLGLFLDAGVFPCISPKHFRFNHYKLSPFSSEFDPCKCTVHAIAIRLPGL